MKKVLVRGPALSRSGYGEHARFVLRALRTREDIFDIYLHSTNWGKTGWLWENNEERQWIDKLIHKNVAFVQSGGMFDMAIQVTIPNEWEKIAPVNIGVTAGIETTKVAPQWIEKSQIVDHIITISEHSKNTFLNSVYQAHNEQTGEMIPNFRCTTPMDVVHYPVKDFEPAELDIDFETDFNFLTIAQISPRKNFVNTIKWFVEEFIDQPVGLVAKVSTINNSTADRAHTKATIEKMLGEYKNRKCKIYLLHGSMTDEEMTALYRHPKIKAYLTLTHGEGFGLPIFEAAYNELPIIAPDWSGHVDFLYAPVKDKKAGKEKVKAHFAKVKYTLQPIQKEAHWDGVLQKDSMWCYAEQGSYKMRLREIYKDYNRFKSDAKKLNKWIRKNFNAETLYDNFCQYLLNYVDTTSNEEVDDMFQKLFQQA
jgi:glycosyltransferase involved in cell wall biosynthesis